MISRGPFYQHGWIIRSIVKFGMKLLIHSQTSMVAPLKFGNGFHPTFFQQCGYLSTLGFKSIHVSKRCPDAIYVLSLQLTQFKQYGVFTEHVNQKLFLGLLYWHHEVQSQQHIWRSGARRWNLRAVDIKLRCRHLTKEESTMPKLQHCALTHV